MKKILFLTSSIFLFVVASLATYAFVEKQNMKSQLRKLLLRSKSNMIYVKGGEFTMGPSDSRWVDGTNYPPHKVKLNSFYISKYNLSFRDFDTYTTVTHQKTINAEALKYHSFFRAPQYPVFAVTWYQAKGYCQWLAKNTGLPYSLPTEAQWEYAARAKGRKNWSFATNNGKLSLGKNFASKNQLENQTGNLSGGEIAMPNGSFPPNPLGIYDMNGQVDQWILDWFSPDYYSRSPLLNPNGPESGLKKVVRGGDAGGSFEDNVYHRAGFKPSFAEAGFRCVINSSVPPNKLGAFAKGHPKH